MADDIKSKIADLEKELYSKEFKPLTEENTLTHREIPVAESWETQKSRVSSPEQDAQKERRHSMMKKITKFSIAFFFIAVGITSFVWWRGLNVISGSNVAIDVSAPIAVAGGEAFDTNLVITNNNKVAIDEATILVEYPNGFYSVVDKTELPRTTKDLGPILPGQVITEKISALLYGEQSTTKKAMVTLEYRLAGSNATLKKTATYEVKISSSPVNIVLDTRKEVSSGQEVEIALQVSSNTKDPTGALVVNATYPVGFTFKSANPAPDFNNNSWQIASLAPQESRTIKIQGVIEGQENEEKITRASVGAQNTKDQRVIGIAYNAISESTIIMKPFLGVDILVNNERTPQYVTALGRTVQALVSWQNNNAMPLTDVVMEVKLSGDILNRYSVFASEGGFYRSLDSTIVWDKRGNAEFRVMEAGAKGSLGFSFSPRALDVSTATVVKNPQVNFVVTAHAKRDAGAGTSEDVTTFASRTVKFDTDLRLGARGLYFAGPFKNTGALPPKVEKETTYTISLSARNSSNSVSNTLIKTTLPIYVKWLGKIAPLGEGITYNDSTAEVVWNAGRIPAGGTREASFQISFTPSVSQLGQAPKLTGDILLFATDDFTKTELRDQKPPISTYLSLDPQVGQSQTIVVN